MVEKLKLNLPWQPLVFVAGVMLFSLSLTWYSLGNDGNHAVEHYQDIDAAEKLVQEVAQAHLWLEEHITGDERDSMAQFGKHMDQAIAFEYRLKINRQKRRDASSDDSSAYHESLTNQLAVNMQKFREIAEMEFQNPKGSTISGKINKQLNQLLENIIGISDQLEDGFSKELQRDQQVFERNNTLLLLLNLLLGILAFSAVIMADKKRRIAIKAEIYARDILYGTEKILERSQQEANIGSWDWHVLSGELVWSDETYRILGYEPSEVVPSFELFLERIHPDDRQHLQESVDKALHEKAPYKLDCRIIRLNGEERVAMAQGSVLYDDADKPVRMFGIFQDITERELRDAELKDSRQKYQTLVDNLPQNLFIKDCNSAYISCNKTYAANLGLEPADIIGRRDETFFPAELAEKYQADDRRVMESGQKEELVEEYLDQGEKKFVQTVKVPIIDDAGQVCGVLGIFWDVTDKLQAEEQIKLSKESLSEAQRIAHVGSWELDLTTDTLVWSDEVFRIFEIDKNKFGASYEAFLDAIHPDDRDRVHDAYTCSVETKEPYEIKHRLLFEDNRIKYVNDRCETFYDEAGKPIRSVGTIQDVTEKALSEQHGERLQQVLEASTDLVSMADHAGNMIYMNRAGREMMGVDKDEDVSSFKIADFHSEAEAKKVENNILPIVDKEGRWRGETLLLNRDGREVLTSQLIQAHKTMSGEVEYYSIIGRDITEEKSRQGKMEHVQRLESLGVLAGGIAHDFNNLLTVIMGNAALVSRQLPDDSPFIPNIHNIEDTSKRAADLCRQMLAYSGKGRFVVKPIIISELIREMSQLLTVSIAKNIVFRLDLNSQIPAVDADVTQMQQVIMNLVINASEAIGKRSGAISIATGLLRVDKEYLSTTFLDEELEEGRYVYLEVSDTGCGMDAQTKDRIFEPFFTTKFTGRGLGMAAILGIVRGHRGAIKVYSELGKGTTFKILFPCSEQEPTSINIDQGEVRNWRGVGCVLIVDDEETIREIAVAMLEDMGFETLTAVDGLEGVEMFRTHRDKISAVLLDMTMPRMGGEDAFTEMYRIDSNVKVILSSGYTEQDATSRFAGKGLAGFLQKPYMPNQLAGKLKELLDKA